MQDASAALHHGLFSIAASYLIVAIGIAGFLLVGVVGEVGALVVGPALARRGVRWIERRLGVILVVVVLIVWVARAFGH